MTDASWYNVWSVISHPFNAQTYSSQQVREEHLLDKQLWMNIRCVEQGREEPYID